MPRLADVRDMPHATFLPPTWARSAVLTNSACRSWVNGSSPVVRCWPAGSSRRLLDMVEGRSKQVFKTWLGERDTSWRDCVEVVAMDGFTGFKSSTGSARGT